MARQACCARGPAAGSGLAPALAFLPSLPAPCFALLGARPVGEMVADEAEQAGFRQTLLRPREEEDTLVIDPRAITMAHPNLFTAKLNLPGKAPVGLYALAIVLIAVLLGWIANFAFRRDEQDKLSPHGKRVKRHGMDRLARQQIGARFLAPAEIADGPIRHVESAGEAAEGGHQQPFARCEEAAPPLHAGACHKPCRRVQVAHDFRSSIRFRRMAQPHPAKIEMRDTLAGKIRRVMRIMIAGDPGEANLLRQPGEDHPRRGAGLQPEIGPVQAVAQQHEAFGLQAVHRRLEALKRGQAVIGREHLPEPREGGGFLEVEIGHQEHAFLRQEGRAGAIERDAQARDPAFRAGPFHFCTRHSAPHAPISSISRAASSPIAASRASP
jgi:hypothetical protein